MTETEQIAWTEFATRVLAVPALLAHGPNRWADVLRDRTPMRTRENVEPAVTCLYQALSPIEEALLAGRQVPTALLTLLYETYRVAQIGAGQLEEAIDVPLLCRLARAAGLDSVELELAEAGVPVALIPARAAEIRAGR